MNRAGRIGRAGGSGESQLLVWWLLANALVLLAIAVSS
jgi:hypothetical protein